MYYILAILIFGFLIFIHELGHYTSARAFGVTVNEFAIGMGPKLLSHVSKKTGIRYSLRLLPFGGFVSMAGEDEESEDENALNKKPVWQRIIITAAGGFMNLVVGFLLLTIVVCSTKNLGSTTVLRFTAENAVSEQSGLMIGDEILKIGTQPTRISNELSYAIMRQGTETVDVVVLRDGEKVTLRIDFPKTEIDGMTYGAPDFMVRAEQKTVGVVLKHTFYQSISTVRMIWESLFDLVTGKIGVNQVSGPVGVTQAMAQTAKSSLIDLIYLSAVIAVNLGLVNLLPLPALDGGRIFFQLIELIRGKPLKPEVEGYIHFAGLALLMILMVVITLKDVTMLFRR